MELVQEYFLIYGKASGSYMKYDEDANDCGRLIVANSSTRLTCGHSI